MTNPWNVWQVTWKLLADGILYDMRKQLKSPYLNIEICKLEQLCLIEIEKLLVLNDKSLKDFDIMPIPQGEDMNEFGNILLFNELNYDVHEMQSLHDELLPMLNHDQRNVHDKIATACYQGTGVFFFVYGYGGTGKIFLWKKLSYKLRAEGKIVINVASSGIASLLLPGGKTTHSQFSIPLVLNEDSCCFIKQGSLKAELLQHASLIIWDEAPMVNRWEFEAFDRTLRDLMRFKISNSSDKPFGGKVVVLGGDFRQILPVVPNASRSEIVLATINSSRLWKHCKVLRLTENMRLHVCPNDFEYDVKKQFADWVLALGDGKLGIEEDGESLIDIPASLLMEENGNPIHDIVMATYPGLFEDFGNVQYFKERAILASTLEVVGVVNDYLISILPGDEKVYLSSDSLLKLDDNVGIQSDWVTVEVMNDNKCSGMPDHRLVLKKGVPVMLLRNLDISSGLCNGTRLIIEEMGVNVIGAIILTENNIGSKVYIPRMNLILSDRMTPFKFQGRQFPLIVCFAMTINKSQDRV